MEGEGSSGDGVPFSDLFISNLDFFHPQTVVELGGYHAKLSDEMTIGK